MASGWGSTVALPPTRSASGRASGVALGEPRYVSRIDPLSNTIQLGRREDLETTTIALERVSFVAGGPPASGPPASRIGSELKPASAIAQRRSPPRSAPATALEPARGGRWIVETDEPVWAAAPGQACVLYDGDIVFGRRPNRAA